MSAASALPGQVVLQEGLAEPPGVERLAGAPGGDGDDHGGEAVGLEAVPGDRGQAEPVEDPLQPLEPELGIVRARPEAARRGPPPGRQARRLRGETRRARRRGRCRGPG